MWGNSCGILSTVLHSQVLQIVLVLESFFSFRAQLFFQPSIPLGVLDCEGHSTQLSNLISAMTVPGDADIEAGIRVIRLHDSKGFSRNND
jgi:hypothetical protein